MATANSTNNPTLITWDIPRINRLLDPKNDINHQVSIRHSSGSRYNKLTWELELLFNQSSSRFTDWISFSLRLVDANKTVNVKFKIWIVNNNGVRVLMDNANDEVIELHNKEIYPLDRFIRKEDLFANFDEYAPNETLTIVIEINVLQCVTNHVFLPKRERIKREDKTEPSDYSNLSKKQYILRKMYNGKNC
ncbi:uncharacterized protein LOC106693320 [Microplitis demolitor]|uniref:uncharacterized protein LOC106693320 n=1 Tax=Microplitis demolitor TaxID=69319 RepID=UPI0006D501FE|nr:uncharacterized protein LOC106693320 [Microplitis demolitor]